MDNSNTKPDTLISVPNENSPIPQEILETKYLVLQNFWLKDICIKAGQTITGPVSKRWIQLRLIEPIGNLENSNTEENKDSIENITLKDVFANPKMHDPDVVLSTDAIKPPKPVDNPTGKMKYKHKDRSKDLLDFMNKI